MPICHSLSGCWRFPAGGVAGKTVSLPRAPDEPARMRLAHRSRRTSGQMDRPGSGAHLIFTLRFPARQGKRGSQSLAVASGELTGEAYRGFAREVKSEPRTAPKDVLGFHGEFFPHELIDPASLRPPPPMVSSVTTPGNIGGQRPDIQPPRSRVPCE
jgi:hypothetical protein